MGDTTSLSSRKAALRQAVRQQRRALSRAQRRRASREAARHLARALRGARNIAVFLSLPDEIDTAPLIALLRRRRCRLFVPRVLTGGSLRFVRLAARGRMRANRYGIAEPSAGARPQALDVIVVPLVAFDAQGRRLGQGGGYYDRVLARARRTRRIGLAFALQEVRAVPAAAHDIPLDAVATERGFFKFPLPAQRGEG